VCVCMFVCVCVCVCDLENSTLCRPSPVLCCYATQNNTLTTVQADLQYRIL